MVGGTVIEVCDAEHTKDAIYVDCADWVKGRRHPETCAIYVVRSPDSEKIQVGDSLWWQGEWAYWTPAANRSAKGSKAGVDYDIKIERIGFSGVTLPSRRTKEPEDDA